MKSRYYAGQNASSRGPTWSEKVKAARAAWEEVANTHLLSTGRPEKPSFVRLVVGFEPGWMQKPLFRSFHRAYDDFFDATVGWTFKSLILEQIEDWTVGNWVVDTPKPWSRPNIYSETMNPVVLAIAEAWGIDFEDVAAFWGRYLVHEAAKYVITCADMYFRMFEPGSVRLHATTIPEEQAIREIELGKMVDGLEQEGSTKTIVVGVGVPSWRYARSSDGKWVTRRIPCSLMARYTRERAAEVDQGVRAYLQGRGANHARLIAATSSSIYARAVPEIESFKAPAQFFLLYHPVPESFSLQLMKEALQRSFPDVLIGLTSSDTHPMQAICSRKFRRLPYTPRPNRRGR